MRPIGLQVTRLDNSLHRGGETSNGRAGRRRGRVWGNRKPSADATPAPAYMYGASAARGAPRSISLQAPSIGPIPAKRCPCHPPPARAVRPRCRPRGLGRPSPHGGRGGKGRSRTPGRRVVVVAQEAETSRPLAVPPQNGPGRKRFGPAAIRRAVNVRLQLFYWYKSR